MDRDMTQRREWMRIVKTVVEKCIEREARLCDLCPERYGNATERRESLTAIAERSKEIESFLQKLSLVEAESGIGFSVVLGRQPDELEALALSLLVAARLDAAAAHHIRSVRDVVNQCACRNPLVALEARCLFRTDSPLYPLVALGRGIVLDECPVSIREPVFNRIFGLPSDATEARCEAEILAGRGR